MKSLRITSDADEALREATSSEFHDALMCFGKRDMARLAKRPRPFSLEKRPVSQNRGKNSVRNSRLRKNQEKGVAAMNFDFSNVNLEYLIQARDLAVRDPVLAALMLGISADLAQLLAKLTAQDLTHIALIKPPLLILRQEMWWWSRLFTAIREGRMEELAAITEHASLITLREDHI